MSAPKSATANGFAMRPNGMSRSTYEEVQLQRSPSNKATGDTRQADLPRAASYTFVGNAKFQDYDASLSRHCLVHENENDASSPDDDAEDITPPDTSGLTTPDENFPEMEVRPPRLRAIVAGLQKKSDAAPDGVEEERTSLPSTSRTHSSSVDSVKTASTVASTTASTVPTTPRARSSIASNFSRKLNRRSWVSSAPTTPSRSPSPYKSTDNSTTPALDNLEQVSVLAEPEKAHVKRTKSFGKRKDSLKASKRQTQDAQQSSDEREPGLSRKGTLVKKKPRPLSSLFKGQMPDENKTPTEPARGRRLVSSSAGNAVPSTYEAQWPPVPSLPTSYSTDRLPSIRSSVHPQHRAAPMPRLLSSNKAVQAGVVPTRKKDELWSIFRSLDADLAKFQAKTLALKANVVRNTLLPFLRTYASHPSTRSLRPEDLDRRANILNKWWTGLIEMLHGRNNQSISGTDRPTILDGIAGIMERPEWRLPPSPFCPLDQRMNGTSTPRNQSSTSFTSSNSDFLAESVYHNVRNIFIQNLSSQMSFVVDKMSVRNASASLVTFCGKACAYAFMFVPGMADVLVRLWDPQMDILRRVLEGNSIGKFEDLSAAGPSIVSAFPTAVRQLGFTSLMKYMRKLRTPPPLPLAMNNVQWWGPWLERWSGRESDLFYVFVKYYHILASGFLPADSTKQERMCAPGFLLVHSQILTTLDATIHRDAGQNQSDPTTMGASPTFDDVFAEPDAVASALPLPPTNATRLMAENRMIMLIRDFLSERAAEHPIARRVFAESFNDLLETATRGTSIYDHYACYTLLDFLEEALHLLIRFEKVDGTQGSIINCTFWTSVWKKMIESSNTMTEVRLYAFLYTVWNTVICELGWKSSVCDEIVLNPEIFESRFNHWCPLVRQYFMRILCWRVGRYDGEPTPGAMDTFETLLQRLQLMWSYYLYLREQAVRNDRIAPSTVPCNPAPSRRLLIVRTDPQITTPVAFLSFDGVVSPKTPPSDMNPTALKRFSSASQTFALDPIMRPDSSMSMASDFSVDMPRGRGLGGFLKNLVSGKSRSRSHGRIKPGLDEDQPPVPRREIGFGGITRAATNDTSISAPPVLAGGSVRSVSQAPQIVPFQPCSFKFSLEYHAQTKPHPPLRLSPPRLPLPAHHYVATFSDNPNATNGSLLRPVQPRTTANMKHARYCGRALAEWAMVVGECQGFFERRERDGVTEKKFVETPALGVEVFRRQG